jgi:hypothetical protein
VDDDLLVTRMQVGPIEYVLGGHGGPLRQEPGAHVEQVADQDLRAAWIAAPLADEISHWLIERADLT